MEKSGRAREVTGDNITWRMRVACRITKATDTRKICNVLIDFPGQRGYANVPQCYVTHTLPLLLKSDKRLLCFSTPVYGGNSEVLVHLIFVYGSPKETHSLLRSGNLAWGKHSALMCA